MLMEDNFISFLVLFTLIVIILIFSLVLKVGKRSKTNSNLPPGPWKLPIFGSIHHLISISNLPHHCMRDLSNKYGPIMHLQLGETSGILVSSPQIAKEVLKIHDVAFAQRPRFPGAEIATYGCTDITFAPYAEYYKHVIKICTLELLSAKRVRSFQSIREEEVSNLIRYVSSNTGSLINFTDQILSMTYSITARAAFGDKCKDQEAYYILFMKESMKVAESFSITNLFPSQKWLHVVSGMKHKFNKIHRTSDMVLENIIHAATTKKSDDDDDGHGSLLSVLLSLRDHGIPEFHLTINNIKAILQVS